MGQIELIRKGWLRSFLIIPIATSLGSNQHQHRRKAEAQWVASLSADAAAVGARPLPASCGRAEPATLGRALRPLGIYSAEWRSHYRLESSDLPRSVLDLFSDKSSRQVSGLGCSFSLADSRTTPAYVWRVAAAIGGKRSSADSAFVTVGERRRRSRHFPGRWP